MISEDPNEVVPSNHFDDTEDEYYDEVYYVINPHTGEFEGEHHETIEDAISAAEFDFPNMDARIENADGEDIH